jgi:hypothetical protein
MKKLISILFLFVSFLFIGNAQKQSQYINTDKKDTVTISIVSENKKLTSTNDNLQLFLAKTTDSQVSVNSALIDVLTSLESGISTYCKEIEKRNKNDSKLITDVFNYNSTKVTKAINTNKVITIILNIFALLYISFAIYLESSRARLPAGVRTARIIFLLGYGIAFYYIILKLLITIFNGDYYVIKELINLYT